MALTRFRQTPRPYMYSDHPGLVLSSPRVPSPPNVTNLMKYFLFQLRDKWCRMSYDRLMENELELLSTKFQKIQKKYFEVCNYIDSLATSILEVSYMLNTPTDHASDLQYRFSCRIAELKILKSNHAKDLLLTRMKFYSILTAPVIETAKMILAYNDQNYFCFQAHNDSPIICVLQWIFKFISGSCFPFTKANNAVDNLIGNMEIYIDMMSVEVADEFLQIGGSAFSHKYSIKYLIGIEYYASLREVKTFLLVSKHFLRTNVPYVKNRKVIRSAISSFFQCQELINLVIEYLVDPKQTPRKFLFD